MSKVSEHLKRTLLTAGHYFSLGISNGVTYDDNVVAVVAEEEEETAFSSTKAMTRRRHAPRRLNNESETGASIIIHDLCSDDQSDYI